MQTESLGNRSHENSLTTGDHFCDFFRLHHMIFLRTSSSAPLRLSANVIKKSLKCSENWDLDIYVSMATGQTSSAEKHPTM